MKAIQEIISLLQKCGATSADTLKVPFKNHSRTRQFFYFLLNRNNDDSQIAARHFFQEDPSSLIYTRTKRSLLNQLVQVLFLVDIKKMGDSSHQRAYYHCWKNMCAAKILLGHSAHHAAIHLIKKILARAKRHELSDLNLECYKILRWYYACIEGNTVQYHKYDRLFHLQKKIYEAEQMAEDHYTQISSIYQSDKSQRHFLANLALKYWNEVADMMEVYNSSRLHYLGHLIHLYHYTCSGNYSGAIKANEEAVSFFEKKEGPASFYLNTFHNHQLICYIKSKHFIAGQSLVKKLDQTLKPGSFNWFVSRQFYFTLAMHTLNFEQARLILTQVITHRRFKYIPRTQSEKWRIKQAYLYYLEVSGYLKKEPYSKRVFKHRQFFQTVPRYSKNKRDINVPILILSILILIAKKKYSLVINRMDALEKYCGHCPKMEDNYRSNCFIKMLLCIPKADFHPSILKRKVNKLETALSQFPLQLSTPAYELEIIPYEKLWTIVVSSL